jgi:cytochrome c556
VEREELSHVCRLLIFNQSIVVAVAKPLRRLLDQGPTGRMSKNMNHRSQAEFHCNGVKNRSTAVARLRGFAGALGIVVVLAATPSHADDQDVIDYRRHIMKTMGEEAAILGMIMQQKAPATDFAAHVQVLATTAATAKQAFEPKIAGGDSKPEVWAQWADFAKRMDALTAATADLAKSAKDGGVAAAGPKIQTALTCKGCHDTYRVPKK